jgi:putative glutamine amidotransferase
VEPRPIVGISEGFADYGDYYGFGYGRPLLTAGGLPVLLPYYERAEDRLELLGRLDGLVLAGGRDVEAWRYGRAEPHPKHLPGLPHLDEMSCTTRGRPSRRASRCSRSAAGARC